MKDGQLTNSLSRAVYRGALAARKVAPRQRSRSFAQDCNGSVGRIYVINLDRQTGRWHQIQQELTRARDGNGRPLLNLTKRLGAVDARYHIGSLPELVNPIYTLADQLYVDPRPLPATVGSPAGIPIKMSQEEVAVALSHVKVWELIATGAHHYALVLEDDVYFTRAFSRILDHAWSGLTSKGGLVAFDLLYVSYREARSGAEWAPSLAPTRQPVRGIWQLSGYVLSKRGAEKLLDQLPVRGPVDLWINFAFGSVDVFALRRPIVKQRRDLPSSNFYSALSVLSKVGLETSDRPPLAERRALRGPVFGVGQAGTGVTALGMALSILGYRCCSDVTDVPDPEQRALIDKTARRVFDAYVNVGSLTPMRLLQLAKIHPESKFIITTLDERVAYKRDGNRADAQPAVHEECRPSPLRILVDELGGVSARCLIVPAAHSDKWRLLTEFLGCDYPSHPYPRCGDRMPRSLRRYGNEARPPSTRWKPVRARWDSSPWIAASDGWCGVPLIGTAHNDTARVSERFRRLGEGGWLLRNDTFPGNLALFTHSNFASVGDGAGELTIRRERSSVRDYTSAALSTRDRYRYGRFGADLMPAKVPGLVTGMFLHRNSPRQEIDIEFLGNDTTKLLANIYFNPGEEGMRLEYGYRGTPEVIDLGFDAADAFHRYEIDWSPERVRWFVDGELAIEREHWNPTPVPCLPMQFHINLWYTRSSALAGRVRHRKLPAYTYLRRVELTSPCRIEAEGRDSPVSGTVLVPRDPSG